MDATNDMHSESKFPHKLLELFFSFAAQTNLTINTLVSFSLSHCTGNSRSIDTPATHTSHKTHMPTKPAVLAQRISLANKRPCSIAPKHKLPTKRPQAEQTPSPSRNPKSHPQNTPAHPYPAPPSVQPPTKHTCTPVSRNHRNYPQHENTTPSTKTP